MTLESEKALVSVVMPVFNAERYLATAIESVLQQTHFNFELILIDDCSRDNSFIIAKRYESDGRMMVFQNRSNMGVSYTRNFGIQRAKGHYVAFLDGDDIWMPAFLECQLEILMKNPDIALLGCDFDLIDQEGNDITPPEVKQSRNNRNASQILIEYPIQHLIYKSPIIPSTWLVKADVINKAGLFKEHLIVCEDHELILSLSMLGRVCETNRILTLYRKHNSQLTTKGDLFLEYRARAFDSFLEHFPDAPARVGVAKLRKRMCELHQLAGDNFYWSKQDFKEARKSYLRSLSYSPIDFARWRNLTIAAIPSLLHRPLRKYLDRRAGSS